VLGLLDQVLPKKVPSLFSFLKVATVSKTLVELGRSFHQQGTGQRKRFCALRFMIFLYFRARKSVKLKLCYSSKQSRTNTGHQPVCSSTSSCFIRDGSELLMSSISSVINSGLKVRSSQPLD